jgi:hypothetical protein
VPSTLITVKAQEGHAAWLFRGSLAMRYRYFNGAEGLLMNSIILDQNCSAASAFACSLPPR